MADAWDGRPLNPERDGWHWLESPRGFVRPCLWNPGSKTWLERGSMADMTGAGWRYLGPCLTPDEVAAREAAAAAAEREACAQEADCGCAARADVLARLATDGEKRASYLCVHGDVCCALQAAAIRARGKETKA